MEDLKTLLEAQVCEAHNRNPIVDINLDNRGKIQLVKVISCCNNFNFKLSEIIANNVSYGIKQEFETFDLNFR